MPNLYQLVAKRNSSESSLKTLEKFTVYYHSIFDYPLNFGDMVKWSVADWYVFEKNISVSVKEGYLYLTGKEGSVYKRILRKRISSRKLLIAKNTARLLSFIPSVKMIGITGSLAMQNSSEDSDIDLMIVTKKGMLWTTRLLSYLVIWLFRFDARKPGGKNQKDKLCLNMWLDESDLIWKKSNRNFYTAHEIAQIIPLVNKKKTYEKFLFKNKWILDFWPNAVKIYDLRSMNYESKKSLFINQYSIFNFVERLAYELQKIYMKKKITREVVTPTRALFHPQDWGKVVIERLKV